jgi:hypothetical protein
LVTKFNDLINYRNSFTASGQQISNQTGGSFWGSSELILSKSERLTRLHTSFNNKAELELGNPQTTQQTAATINTIRTRLMLR